MNPLANLRYRMEAHLDAERGLAWEAYKASTQWALSHSPSGLPASDGLLQSQQVWASAARARDEYCWKLKRYTVFVRARTREEMFEWAALMGWECATEAAVVKKVREVLDGQRKRPGREGISRKQCAG